MRLGQAIWAFWYVLRGHGYVANVALHHAHIGSGKTVKFEGVDFLDGCTLGRR